MFPRIYFFCLFLCTAIGLAQAQEDLLQAGPMVGYSSTREVQLWVQTSQPAEVRFRYWPTDKAGEDQGIEKSTTVQTDALRAFTAHITLRQLEPSTEFSYELFINNKKVGRPYPLRFQTLPAWEHREDPPEFTFALGSCAHINDAPYDRKGKPYGRNYEIFTSIHEARPDFMLWLGDNVYLRPGDIHSLSGIHHRYTHHRSTPELQALLGSTHHYAIWDDHDYGPNDSERSFHNKALSYQAFQDFWANPNTNLTGEGGLTSTFVWGDVQFFLLDNRWFRTPQHSLFEEEQIIGEDQLQWLIESLQYSKANFKIIAIGGQLINPTPVYENHAVFAEERARIIDLLDVAKAEGVLFLSGDRHHTILSKLERPDSYPLYDLTCSPLTSKAYSPKENENPPSPSQHPHYQAELCLGASERQLGRTPAPDRGF